MFSKAVWARGVRATADVSIQQSDIPIPMADLSIDDAPPLPDDGDIPVPLLDNNNDDDDMVEAPSTVNSIQINYARKAKKVNVKLVKKEFWNILEQSRANKTVSFKEVQDKLCHTPGLLPEEDQQNLTPAFCFLCLLHLANEHGLVISDPGTTGDVIISNI